MYPVMSSHAVFCNFFLHQTGGAISEEFVQPGCWATDSSCMSTGPAEERPQAGFTAQSCNLLDRNEQVRDGERSKEMSM